MWSWKTCCNNIHYQSLTLFPLSLTGHVICRALRYYSRRPGLKPKLLHPCSISSLLANTRVPRFHKTRFLFERTRELASHRRDQKESIVVEVSRVAAGGRNGGPSRCDSALLEIIFSCPSPSFFFFSFPPCAATDFLYPVGDIYLGALRDKPSEFRLRR